MINHSTFINISGYVFLDLGYQGDFSTTNNIFVNSNVQAYHGVPEIDAGEQDPDGLPMGLVNVIELPDSVDYPRKYLFEGNVVYWDDRLSDIASTLSADEVNGISDWKDQQIVMNERTQQMFDNDAEYPYLTLGTNYMDVLPNFTDPADLLTDQVDALKEYSIASADTAGTAVMDAWRLVNVGEDYYIYPDWPIPVDLSYDDTNLLSGATGGFPVGDLNWFPDEKAAWNAQRSAEYAAIHEALNSGTTTVGVEEMNVPEAFDLQQNYPNPFNPTTEIKYSIPTSGNVTLTVYNTLGQEIATLVDGYKTANHMHKVTFNASNLTSGVYFYSLQTEDFSQTKKMLLVK
ncbi:MAG: T9SS type A sorting domain-containing protein [candidate division KSB1 bacterium]|nr:T9SS type A sorting domain-containing protein [candidate division KSB1 bacterium]